MESKSYGPDETRPPVPDAGEKTKSHIRNPTATQRFRPIPPHISEKARERFTIMGPDGILRTDLRVKSQEYVDGRWMVTLHNPDEPENAENSVTLTHDEFEQQRSWRIVDTPRVFSGKKES